MPCKKDVNARSRMYRYQFAKKKCLYSQTLACFVPIKDVQLAVSVYTHYLLIFSNRSTSVDYASKDLLNPKMKFI